MLILVDGWAAQFNKVRVSILDMIAEETRFMKI
jgi:hypothetical protein